MNINKDKHTPDVGSTQNNIITLKTNTLHTLVILDNLDHEIEHVFNRTHILPLY